MRYLWVTMCKMFQASHNDSTMAYAHIPSPLLLELEANNQSPRAARWGKSMILTEKDSGQERSSWYWSISQHFSGGVRACRNLSKHRNLIPPDFKVSGTVSERLLIKECLMIYMSQDPSRLAFDFEITWVLKISYKLRFFETIYTKLTSLLQWTALWHLVRTSPTSDASGAVW